MAFIYVLTKQKHAIRIILIMYSLFEFEFVTECISDHIDTNKRNNFLNLICALNVYLNNEHGTKNAAKLK